MSPRHALRASTILRSTPKFRGWEAKWKKQVTGSMPWRCHTWALSLCFSLLPIYEEVSSLCHMILQPRPRMMDWNLRHCELKQDPPTPQLFLPILSRCRQAHAHSHLSLLSQWRWHRWNVSIGWQRYEIREQDGGGGALTATPLPPSFSTSIYVLHGFKSDSIALIIMLNIFLLDFFQETLRYISVLGGNGYRWCPWPMGHGIILWFFCLLLVSTKGGLDWNLAAHFHLWLYHFHPYTPGKSLLLTSPLYTHFKDKDHYTQESQRI